MTETILILQHHLQTTILQPEDKTVLKETSTLHIRFKNNNHITIIYDPNTNILHILTTDNNYSNSKP